MGDVNLRTPCHSTEPKLQSRQMPKAYLEPQTRDRSLKLFALASKIRLAEKKAGCSFLAGRELDRWKLSGFLHRKRLSRSKSLKPSDGRSQRHTGSLARPNPHSVQRDLEAARRSTCPSYRNTRDLTTLRATEATHHEARFWAVASLTGLI